MNRRVVFDTSVLVRAVVTPRSWSRRALDVARTEDWLLASEATLNELSEVMMRPKFDRLVDLRLRIAFIKLYVTAVQMVPIHRRVAFCRDPKDDLFLEVAINGRADCVVTEDDDMIDMCAIEGIPILTPAAFLDLNGP